METNERRKIDEASEYCGVACEIIIHFIEETWIRPHEADPPLFDEEDLARIRLIRDLRDEFGVNEEGIPIILNLLDQVNRMHLEVERLKRELN